MNKIVVATLILAAAAVIILRPGANAEMSAEAHLRKSLTSIVIEVAPHGDPFCRAAIYCFQYRGVNYAGQLERGMIRQNERTVEPAT